MPQPLNDMYNEPLKHLAHHLIWTLYKHLYWPPWFDGHVCEEPFARFLTGVKLLR